MYAPSIAKLQNQPHHSRAARLLLIVLTLWALAMIVPGLQRVFDSLDSFGLAVNNDGVITGVLAPFASPNDSPAASAGITPGDRIDLKSMRCIPADVNTPRCASLLVLLGGLGETQAALPHSQITLTIQAKSGAPPRTINLHSAPVPLGHPR